MERPRDGEPAPYSHDGTCTEGIIKGEAKAISETGNLICFPLETPGESEDHAEGSRRLFAYFLVGEKVCPRREHSFSTRASLVQKNMGWFFSLPPASPGPPGRRPLHARLRRIHLPHQREAFCGRFVNRPTISNEGTPAGEPAMGDGGSSILPWEPGKEMRKLAIRRIDSFPRFVV